MPVGLVNEICPAVARPPDPCATAPFVSRLRAVLAVRAPPSVMIPEAVDFRVMVGDDSVPVVLMVPEVWTEMLVAFVEVLSVSGPAPVSVAVAPPLTVTVVPEAMPAAMVPVALPRSAVRFTLGAFKAMPFELMLPSVPAVRLIVPVLAVILLVT